MDDYNLDDILAAYSDKTGKYLINSEVDYVPTDQFLDDYVVESLQAHFNRVNNVVELFDDKR